MSARWRRGSAEDGGDDADDAEALEQRSREAVARINEHLARAKKEVHIKAERLRELNRLHETAQARKAAAAGQVVEKQYIPFEQLADSMSPVEGLVQVQKAVESLTNAVKKLGMDDTDSGLKHIRIYFGAEECWFRITPKTTFGELNHDACRYWRTDGVLRDQANLAWPRSHRVQQEISRIKALTGSDDECVLRLGPTIVSNEPALPTPRGGPSLAPIPTPETSESVDAEDDDPDEKVVDDYVEMSRSLSVVFHDSAYEASSGPQRAGQTLRSCAWLLIWVVVVALVVSTMVYRFTTASAFYSQVDLEAVLVRGAFAPQPPLSFAAGITTRRFFSAPAQPASENFVQIDDTWTWLNTILLPALFPVSASESARLASSTQPLLGSVLIKQWRVSNSSCVFVLPSGALPSTATPCFGPYTLANRQTSGFGNFSFSSSNSPVVYGQMAVYDASGYGVELNSSWTLSQASSALDALKSQGWLDQGTRAVCVFASLGNTNLGWAVSFSALMEFGPSGLALTSLSAQETPLSIYSVFDQYEPLLIVGDVVLCLYAIAMLWISIVGPTLSKRTSFFRVMQTAWSWVALVLFILVLAQIVCSMVFEFHSRYYVNPSTWAVVGGPYTALGPMQSMFNAILGLSAATLLLVLISAFKFTQVDLFASRLWQTLHRAARHLGLAVIVFSTALASMVIWACLAWGPSIHAWSSGGSAAALLVGVIFGSKVDFAELRYADYTLVFACIFFIVWFAMVLLVLLQLLGALVVDAYFEVAIVLPLDDTHSFSAMLWRGWARMWDRRWTSRTSRTKRERGKKAKQG